MISAPARKGASKNQYISEVVLGELWRRRDRFNALRWTRIADLHAWLTKFNGWGNFMAYQACVDMRFTRILYGASDIQRWAAAGPGTIRGLNRIYNRDVKCSISQEQARAEMRSIYIIVQDATNVALDFSDVPNILCEMDKYLRVLNGEGKPRALYVAGRGC
jgi:hypothetical protein